MVIILQAQSAHTYAILNEVMKKFLIACAGLIIVATVVVIIFHHDAKSPAPSTNQKTYVALGDSVAAGVGLKDDSDASACNRTNQAYPNLIAQAQNYNLKNIACTGATIPAGILGKQDVNELLVAPQLEQLFALPKPSLVTLTIGANDIDWSSLIATCYTGVCGTAEDQAMVENKLAIMTTNLRTVLTQIQTHYGSNPPHIIVTGYHQVFPATDVTDCADLQGVDVTEQAWGRGAQAKLSEVIQSAVSSYSFVTYAPISFSGHEACTPDSWVQGLHDKQPAHPTEAGQAAYAKQITAVIQAKKLL
jgi:lysophospholipase L1-like esterase